MKPAGLQFSDALLYRSTPGTRRSMTSFFNLVSNAVTYGMVMGSVRCGLGTDNPVGPSIPGPSLYYQGLHAYSAFDWEFQEQLLRGCDAGALPADTVIIAGRFPDSFVDSFTNEHLEEVATAQRIACTLAPSLSPFAFRLLEEEDLSLCADASGPTFAPKVRDALWQGSKAKLEAIAEVACATESEDLERKLSTMASAFMPLSTVFGASFNAEDPSKSFTRLAVYLPALHMLHAEDVDTPSSWHLERGFESVALPSPVQVSAARVTHLSYLSCADKTREQGIKFEVRRHFDEPQQVTMVVSFGRLFSKDSDDVLGMDCSDHRDAPYLHLHGHVPPSESDSAQTRTVKDSANRALAGFEVEARVHQLTLHLDQGEVAGRLGEEQLLCPRFSLDESRLSFRIERHTESKVERVSLQAAGFEWQEAKDGNGYLCWREFWTWDRLREFFGGPSASGGGLASLLVTGRERLLGQVVSHATKLVLDHSIESIEESLDQEIARLVGEALERYSTARDVLAARLHKGLF